MNMNDDLFELVVKGIILSRGESGATIAEMRSDYSASSEEPWPLAHLSTSQLVDYLSQIDRIKYVVSESGAFIWYVDCGKGRVAGGKGSMVCEDTNVQQPSARRALIFDQQIDKSARAAPPQKHTNPSKIEWSKEAKADNRRVVQVETVSAASKDDRNEGECGQRKGQRDSGYGRISSTSSAHDVLSSQSSSNSVSDDLSSGHSHLNRIQETDENNNLVRRSDISREYSVGSSQDETAYVRKNWNRVSRRSIPSISVNRNHDVNEDTPILYNTELMGDNLFLNFAKIDLGCRLNESVRPKRIGLCVYGQTLQVAANQLLYSTTQPQKTELIINLGSLDILMGRELIDIEHDFVRLIEICEQKNIRPRLTTLAPLLQRGFKAHDKRICQTLLQFNRFIVDRYQDKYQVIDIWSCFTNERGKTLFDCYQPLSVDIKFSERKVSFALWNRIGRQRTLRAIKKALSDRM